MLPNRFLRRHWEKHPLSDNIYKAKSNYSLGFIRSSKIIQFDSVLEELIIGPSLLQIVVASREGRVCGVEDIKSQRFRSSRLPSSEMYDGRTGSKQKEGGMILIRM